MNNIWEYVANDKKSIKRKIDIKIKKFFIFICKRFIIGIDNYTFSWGREIVYLWGCKIEQYIINLKRHYREL